jgi:hypothetical protein
MDKNCNEALGRKLARDGKAQGPAAWCKRSGSGSYRTLCEETSIGAAESADRSPMTTIRAVGETQLQGEGPTGKELSRKAKGDGEVADICGEQTGRRSSTEGAR